MRNTVVALLTIAAVAAVVRAAEPESRDFTKLRLSDKFYCEGAHYDDFNKDGKLDVVAGPFWYEGPDFQKKHELRRPKEFDPKSWSDNFLTFTGDFNGDGWPDVLVVPWPGRDTCWYENPIGRDGPWRRHLALKETSNESPMWGDVDGDGRPELICCHDGHLGYAAYEPARPEQPWTFHAVTPRDPRFQPYTHGLGFGDVNGDKRSDLIEAAGWWEQPIPAEAGAFWKFHPFKFAEAAAQMFVYDVDGDSLNDVITVWHCHQYGLVWYKQTQGLNGEIGWQQHVILPPKPNMASGELRISQMHAVELVDMNGDGLKDILTGKRFWAHGPDGDAEPNAPAVLYWFELRRDKDNGAQFIPHRIDDNSGVGTQVTAVDLTGDGAPDIITSNKKGTFVYFNQPGK